MAVIGISSLITAIATAAPWLIWVAVIVMAVGLILACLDWILGGVAWFCALLINLVVGLINGIIQFLWTKFVEPFLGIIEWVLNAANGGFNTFGDMVANLIGQIISWFLSLGKVVTKIIDAIFGTDWTAGLESLQDKVLAWGKNEKAITISRDVPFELERMNMGDAWNIGVTAGQMVQNQISGLASKAADKVKESIDSGLNTTHSDITGVNGALGDIASDTSDISDAVALSAEDLEYLRKIAAMEWKKEFTTANITVDMTNHNNISGDNDLDGIVTTLSNKLREELGEVANGVYA